MKRDMTSPGKRSLIQSTEDGGDEDHDDKDHELESNPDSPSNTDVTCHFPSTLRTSVNGRVRENVRWQLE